MTAELEEEGASIAVGVVEAGVEEIAESRGGSVPPPWHCATTTLDLE